MQSNNNYSHQNTKTTRNNNNISSSKGRVKYETNRSTVRNHPYQ